MVDYSRFNHIGSDSDEETPSARLQLPRASPDAAASTSGSFSSAGRIPPTVGNRGDPVSGEGGGSNSGEYACVAQPMMMQTSKKGKEGRIKFEHEGIVCRMYGTEFRSSVFLVGTLRATVCLVTINKASGS